MLPSALPWQACSGKCLLNGYSEEPRPQAGASSKEKAPGSCRAQTTAGHSSPQQAGADCVQSAVSWLFPVSTNSVMAPWRADRGPIAAACQGGGSHALLRTGFVSNCQGSTQLSKVSEKMNAFGKSPSMPKGGSW